MNIKQYLDATYLKTAEQAGNTEAENLIVVKKNIQEAIDEQFKLIMIRPEMVSMAKKMITDAKSIVQVGTVIGFPEGTATVEEKLEEAMQAIADGADDLDFVCNYEEFKAGNLDLVRDEIKKGTQLGIENGRVVKWIIEIAALNEKQIIQISAFIKNIIISNFKEEFYPNVYVKSSTGFYSTADGLPNGATVPAIIMMLENASPLPVKAAGGVRSYDDAVEMIRLGVKRIGTSGAKIIADGRDSNNEY